MENKKIAEVLEGYLIPANEGIVKDLWSSASGFQKGVLIGSAVITGLSAVNGIRNRIKRRMNNKDNSSTKPVINNKDIKTFENIRQIEEEIRNEYPELVEKEMKNRFQSLKKIRDAIIKFDKKYRIEGFGISTDELTELNSVIRNNSTSNIDDSIMCNYIAGFLENLLPRVLEEDLKKSKYSYYKFRYGWENNWNLCIYSGDQWDWWDSLPEDEKVDIRGSNYDYELDLWSQFRDKIPERMMKEMSNIEFVFGIDDGGDNDGSFIGVILKPSKEILNIAKHKGYRWFE